MADDETNQSKSDRKPFNVTLNFLEPMEGTITILANNEDHAKELVEELYSKRKEVQIVDINEINLDDLKQQMIEGAQEEAAETEPLPDDDDDGSPTLH